MPDRSQVIGAIMQADPEPFDGNVSPIEYYGPMADAVMRLYGSGAGGPLAGLTPEEIVAGIRAEAVSDAVSFLKSTPAVTLAGKGGAYELLKSRKHEPPGASKGDES